MLGGGVKTVTVARAAIKLWTDTGEFSHGMSSAEQKTRETMSGIDRELASGSRRVKRHSSAIGAALKIGIAGGIGTAMVGLTTVLHSGWDEFKQGEVVVGQTAAALKSTGGVANVTAAQVNNLANATMRKTGIDYKAVQSGENMLLTFTNIRNEVGKGNDVFTQASKAVDDMATAMNGGAIPSSEQLRKTSILVGKALNDPVKGATALRRVGVTLTAQQQDQIKTLVQSGHTMEAQKLILGELSKEFGGSAVKAGKSLTGQISILKGTFEEWTGSLIRGAMPTITKFVTKLTHFITKLSQSKRVQQDVKAVGHALIAVWHIAVPLVETLAKVVGALVAWLDRHRAVTKMLIVVVGVFVAGLVAYRMVLSAIATKQLLVAKATKAWAVAQKVLNLVMSMNPMARIILLLFAVGAALIYAYKHSATFRRIVQGAFHAALAGAKAVGHFFQKLAHIAGAAFGFIRKHWLLFATLLGGPFGLVIGLLIKRFGFIRKVGRAAFHAFIAPIKAVIGWVKTLIGWVKKVSSIKIHVKTWHGIPTGVSVSWGGGSSGSNSGDAPSTDGGSTTSAPGSPTTKPAGHSHPHRRRHYSPPPDASVPDTSSSATHSMASSAAKKRRDQAERYFLMQHGYHTKSWYQQQYGTDKGYKAYVAEHEKSRKNTSAEHGKTRKAIGQASANQVAAYNKSIKAFPSAMNQLLSNFAPDLFHRTPGGSLAVGALHGRAASRSRPSEVHHHTHIHYDPKYGHKPTLRHELEQIKFTVKSAGALTA